MNKTKLIVLTLVVIGAVALRMLLTDFPNIAPITAIAIFSGVFFEKKYFAFIIPATVMLISDAFIGFHGTMWAVYGAFALSAIIGISLRNRVSFLTMTGASLASSLVFFLLTNFAVWMIGGWYPKTLTGLIECYTLAVPFFGKTILSDLMFTGLFIGGYVYTQSRIPALAKARV